MVDDIVDSSGMSGKAIQNSLNSLEMKAVRFSHVSVGCCV